MRELLFPEFDKTRRVGRQSAHVFDAPCNCDVILGQDVLTKAGMDVLFSNGIVQWMDKLIDMKPNARSENSKNFLLACEQSVDWTDSS